MLRLGSFFEFVPNDGSPGADLSSFKLKSLTCSLPILLAAILLLIARMKLGEPMVWLLAAKLSDPSAFGLSTELLKPSAVGLVAFASEIELFSI